MLKTRRKSNIVKIGIRLCVYIKNMSRIKRVNHDCKP